jgi:hypothetical protein
MFRRPSTSRNQLMTDKVHPAVLDNHRITIRELSDKLRLSYGSLNSILTEDLGTKCISVKFIPQLLAAKQNESHLAVARDLLLYANQDTNFMKTIITSYESWYYQYNPGTKAQSS